MEYRLITLSNMTHIPLTNLFLCRLTSLFCHVANKGWQSFVSGRLKITNPNDCHFAPTGILIHVVREREQGILDTPFDY